MVSNGFSFGFYRIGHSIDGIEHLGAQDLGACGYSIGWGSDLSGQSQAMLPVVSGVQSSICTRAEIPCVKGPCKIYVFT